MRLQTWTEKTGSGKLRFILVRALARQERPGSARPDSEGCLILSSKVASLPFTNCIILLATACMYIHFRLFRGIHFALSCDFTLPR
jgi:hypothetical protein